MEIVIVIGIVTLNLLTLILVLSLRDFDQRLCEFQDRLQRDSQNWRSDAYDRADEIINELKEIHRLQKGLTQCGWKIEQKLQDKDEKF